MCLGRGPLHLIIDGYNLIRQCPELSRLDAQDLEAGRQALLAWLAAYRQRRPHRLTVVFDGWQTGGLNESRDRQQGVAVIFSRRGERADEVIKRLLARERQGALLVSSDRELQIFAERLGAPWISSPEFAGRLGPALAGEPEGADIREAPRGGTAKKGPAKRAAKRERRRQMRLRKL